MPGGRHGGQSRTGLEPTRMLHELRQPPRASLGKLVILVPGQPSPGPPAALGTASPTLVVQEHPLCPEQSSCSDSLESCKDWGGGAGASSWGQGRTQWAGGTSVLGTGRWHQGTSARV